MEDKLRQAIGNAWSFPGLKPPVDAVYIGFVDKGNEKTFYYEHNGKFLYETESGLRFKKRMAEIKREQKRKIKRKKAGA